MGIDIHEELLLELAVCKEKLGVNRLDQLSLRDRRIENGVHRGMCSNAPFFHRLAYTHIIFPSFNIFFSSEDVEMRCHLSIQDHEKCARGVFQGIQVSYSRSDSHGGHTPSLDYFKGGTEGVSKKTPWKRAGKEATEKLGQRGEKKESSPEFKEVFNVDYYAHEQGVVRKLRGTRVPKYLGQ